MQNWDTDSFCHSGIDSREALAGLRKQGLRPKLFLTDPPYNLGFDYGNVDDSLSIDEYHRMLRGVFEAAYDAADDDAHLFIINYPEIIGRMWDDVIAPTTKGGTPRKRPYWEFNQWITWCYPNNWPPVKSRFTRASRAIIWMKKGKPTQNIKQIIQPYRNPWDRRVKQLMGDGNKGPALYDWWSQIDLCKNVSNDKVTDPPYSNQIPEVLLRRIIHITTEPGDLVADPFAGTFSTVKAALQTSRLGWGCDLNAETEIYRPSLEEYDDWYELNHERIKDEQWFDIDARSEPFDWYRAGISVEHLIGALHAGIHVLPKTQQTNLALEIRRLEDYSRKWNINEPKISEDTPLDDVEGVYSTLLEYVPLYAIRNILSAHGVEHSKSENGNSLRSKLMRILYPAIQVDSEGGQSQEGVDENSDPTQVNPED